MTAPAYRIGVIADTHGKLARRVLEVFAGVDLILHAGDIGSEDVLTALEAVAPVTAVRGNVDGFCDPALHPLTRVVETPAGRIVMTHGHLPSAPASDALRMIHNFRALKPDIIIFGHSHIPSLEDLNGVVLFNPGSASLSRWGRGCTVGMIALPAPGARPTFAHVEVE